ncbi:MAG: UDP-3-O-(3-hydroxymyristoyl)glucosamine N-acyltransferase [Lactobacillales bacterium]|jgi:UDP-3-O-[3-hydroxymyristoyl] glucosamine N-acyltransferase|nr:UDP-3-O-(3-hydroxymyristoyl)glucosamine N-acyltransferase [Lactobacillales bacterium]
MADPRFFKKVPQLSLEEILTAGELSVSEDISKNVVFKDVAGLEKATKEDISWAFLASRREALSATKAGAVIVPEKFKELVPTGCIALVSKDPHRSYGLVASLFYPQEIEGFVSPKAFIDPSAEIGEGTRIEFGAYIGKNVRLGKKCSVGPNAVIGDGVVMGDGCIVGANATVSHCIAGNKVYIYPGAHIGQDGFGFAMSPQKGPQKVPQLGRVIIGDDVEIGSGTTVDRGAMNDTEIGSGTRIDNLVQVAHNVKLGKCCIMVSQVGIAGSCEFGDFVVAGGQVGFAGHLKIGTGAQIAAQSGLMNDVPAGGIFMGSPAVPRRDYMRQVIAIQRLGQKKISPEENKE